MKLHVTKYGKRGMEINHSIEQLGLQSGDELLLSFRSPDTGEFMNIA
jgi:hypothetical protein